MQANLPGRPLANLTKMKREKTQICRIRNAKEEITTKHHGSAGNHQRLLQESIFKQIRKS
jgi:hypothetical protein